MWAVSETLFWLSLGFLALTMPLYALLVDNFARARRSAQAGRRSLLDSLRAQIDEAERKWSSETLAGSELRGFERQVRRHRCAVRRAERAFEAFSLSRGVLLPGAALVVSLALVTGARHLQGFSPSVAAAGQAADPMWAFALCGASAAALAVAVILLCNALHSVQHVIELSLPKVIFRLECARQWRAGEASSVTLHATLVQGAVLTGGQIILFVPPGFGLPGPPDWVIPPDAPMLPCYQAVASKRWDTKVWTPFRYEFHHIYAPAQGHHELYYAMTSHEHCIDPVPIPVDVVA